MTKAATSTKKTPCKKAKKNGHHLKPSSLIITSPVFAHSKSVSSTQSRSTNIKHCWTNSIKFRRIGHDQNMYLFQLQQDRLPKSMPSVLQDFLEYSTASYEFAANTNSLAPLVQMRANKHLDSPGLLDDDGSPLLCLFSMKPTNLQHEQYVQYVMNTLSELLRSLDQRLPEFAVDMKEIQGTNFLSLDHYITNDGVKTIIYHYFFAEHLTYQNTNTRTQTYDLSKQVTQTFVAKNPNIAPYFFRPKIGIYDPLAKLFGYKDANKQSNFQSFTYHQDYDPSLACDSI